MVTLSPSQFERIGRAVQGQVHEKGRRFHRLDLVTDILDPRYQDCIEACVYSWSQAGEEDTALNCLTLVIREDGKVVQKDEGC